MPVTPIVPISGVSIPLSIIPPGSETPASSFIHRPSKASASFEQSLSSSSRREILREAASSELSLFSEEESDIVSLSPELSASISQQTHAFSRTLLDNLRQAGIPTDELISLDIDGTGIVHAANGYAQRIDKLFFDNPSLARQANTIVMLNTLEAMQEAASLYERETNTAESDEERREAQIRYEAHLADINHFSASLRFENETLSSMALDHIRMEKMQDKPF